MEETKTNPSKKQLRRKRDYAQRGEKHTHTHTHKSIINILRKEKKLSMKQKQNFITFLKEEDSKNKRALRK